MCRSIWNTLFIDAGPYEIPYEIFIDAGRRRLFAIAAMINKIIWRNGITPEIWSLLDINIITRECTTRRYKENVQAKKKQQKYLTKQSKQDARTILEVQCRWTRDTVHTAKMTFRIAQDQLPKQSKANMWHNIFGAIVTFPYLSPFRRLSRLIFPNGLYSNLWPSKCRSLS